MSIQRQSQPRHALLLGLAAAFAAVTILYSALWMYVVRRPSASVELGFNKTRTVQYEERIHGILNGEGAAAGCYQHGRGAI